MNAQPLVPSAPAAAFRPATITAALVLLVVRGIISLLPLRGSEEIPRIVLLSGYVFAILKFVAAGHWRCRHWAAILGFVVALLDALSAIPGIVFAEEPVLQALAGVWVVVSIVTLVLLGLPAARRACVQAARGNPA